MIFFGAFYSVVTVALTALLYVATKSVIDVYMDMKSRGQQVGEPETLSDSDSQEETDEPAQETAAVTEGESEPA